MKNEMKIEFDAISVNEGFARIAIAAFASPMNPTMEELADIKTAVSEAVTNAIIHGYDNWYGYGKHGDVVPAFIEIHPGKVYMHCTIQENTLYIEIQDNGKGIENVERALEPLYTTRPEHNRSGMGFAFMEAFMDDLEVLSEPGKGTMVKMQKKIGAGSWIEAC